MPPMRTVRSKVFRGTFASWQMLFDEAAQFATELGGGRLINISHSADHSDGVVVVWYWDAAADPTG